MNSHLLNSDPMLLTADYGPFAPMVGIAGSLVAAIVFFRYLLWGKKNKWAVGSVDIPGTVFGLITGVTAVGIAVLWMYASPEFKNIYVLLAIAMALVSVVCFVKFYSNRKLYGYYREKPMARKKTVREALLGGSELTAEASKIKTAQNLSEQEILASFSYNPDRVWTRESMKKVHEKIFWLFIPTLVLGTLLLCIASLIVQVELTGKKASQVFSKKEIPGYNDAKKKTKDSTLTQ